MAKSITRQKWMLDWDIEDIVGSEWTLDLDVSQMDETECVEMANEWLEGKRARSKSARYDFIVLDCDTDADDGNCCEWLVAPFKRKPVKTAARAKKKVKRAR